LIVVLVVVVVVVVVMHVMGHDEWRENDPDSSISEGGALPRRHLQTLMIVFSKRQKKTKKVVVESVRLDVFSFGGLILSGPQ